MKSRFNFVQLFKERLLEEVEQKAEALRILHFFFRRLDDFTYSEHEVITLSE
jgi:hypothetical protein